MEDEVKEVKEMKVKVKEEEEEEMKGGREEGGDEEGEVKKQKNFEFNRISTRKEKQ